MRKAVVSTLALGGCLMMVMMAFAHLCHASVPEVASGECLDCHENTALRSRRGDSRFIDRYRYANSAHARSGIGCVSCHEGIGPVSKGTRIPHRLGIGPKCPQCHEEVNKQYSKSLHAQVSKKLCYACHNPHYSASFRDMSGDERKHICLQCHEANRTHRWLPQKELHFQYLECTSCHSLNAQIGMCFSIVDKSQGSKPNILTYQRLAPFISYGKTLVEMLDQDGDGELSDKELLTFVTRLQQGGIPQAGVDVRILVLKPTHDFTSRGVQTRDCSLCHSTDARFYSKIVLEIPDRDGHFRTIPVNKGILAYRGETPLMRDFYLLGESKISKEDIQGVLAAVRRIGFKWIDLVGAFLIALTLLAVAFHVMLMFLTRKLRRRIQSPGEEEVLPIPSRAWHWVHGLCVFLLLLTGIQLRLPDLVPIFATFLNAVNLHNLTGLVLIADYVFWISHHLWRRDFVTRFFVSPKGFFRDTATMLHYYGYLIFIGESFPRSGALAPPFDPLERSFFLTMMLAFLPVQMFTGVLLMDVRTTMPVIAALGGLHVVDALHLFVAYLLISCLIVHVYFHTLKKYRIRSSRA